MVVVYKASTSSSFIWFCSLVSFRAVLGVRCSKFVSIVGRKPFEARRHQKCDEKTLACGTVCSADPFLHRFVSDFNAPGMLLWKLEKLIQMLGLGFRA